MTPVEVLRDDKVLIVRFRCVASVEMTAPSAVVVVVASEGVGTTAVVEIGTVEEFVTPIGAVLRTTSLIVVAVTMVVTVVLTGRHTSIRYLDFNLNKFLQTQICSLRLYQSIFQ